MQPHSMCAVAFAKFYWSQRDPIVIKGDITMRVDYRGADNSYKFNEYRLSNVKESSDKMELKVYIIRSNGGISCEITSRRNSLKEGAEITMTHSQQHVSGLREVYNLYDKQIASGMHHNSMRYREFKGDSHYTDRLQLKCEVRVNDDPKNPIFEFKNYDLEIKSINYEKAEYAKPSNVIQFPQGANTQRKAA